MQEGAPIVLEGAARVQAERPALEFGGAWEYSPAPESTGHVKLQKRYELFIGGKFVAPKSGRYFETVNPATEEKLAEVAEAGEADVEAAVARRRGRLQRSGRSSAPIERGKYLYRIARLLQEKAREFAILETMDGGKPIKESRDVDIPLAAAHFFYHAGWADKLAYAFPAHRAPSRADRRLRPDHPVELPAPHGGVEDRAGARLRQHRGAEAGRDDAAHRAASGEDLRGGRASRRAS